MNKEFYQISIKHKLLYAIFFLSGFAALLYQIVWQRWMVFFVGISSLSISLIVSAFMAGLGIGYLIGGIIADKIKTKNAIIFFALAELGIGIYALFSKIVLYDLSKSQLFFLDLNNLEKYGLLFILLLVPTLLMGLSLPLLSKSIDLKNSKLQSQFIGNLYFINTLGASLGAIISGLVLIRWLGFQKTVELGALFNFTCVVFGLFISYSKNADDRKVVSTKTTDSFFWNRSFKFWTLQYFISGFISICFELIWFRILDVTIKSMAMTFSIVLGIYLISMAIGSRIGVIYSKKSKSITLKTYLIGQYLVYIYSLTSMLLIYYSIQNFNQLEYLFAYFGKYEASFEPKLILTIYLILPVFLMSVPTFLMGFNFSISQSLIQNDFDKIGRKIGYLQFVNILGATLGSWLITIIGFNYFGMANSIKILGIIGLSYVLFLKYSASLSNLKTLIFGLILSITIYLIPANDKFWAILQGVRDQKTIILDEDDTALSSIKMDIGHQNESIVFVNGLGQSILPFHKDSIHISLGGIPSMIHSSPIDIAIIGLGSGGTLNSVAGNPKTKSIDCFEVIKNQPRILKKYAHFKDDKPVIEILKNPKVNLIFEDGRYSIQKKMKKYDIIQADALRPRSPYAGNLYSKEYFLELKKKLKKNGMMVTWKPTERVANTFCTVFPYVYEIGDFILIGSSEPFKVDKAKFEENLNDKYTQNHFKKSNIDIHYATKNIMEKIEVLQYGKIKEHTDINTDMIPKDEYNALNLIFEKLNIGTN